MPNANLGKVALAMLGILAFQNRDKIGDLLRKGSTSPDGEGMLDQLSKGVSGTALGDVLDRFRNAGAQDKVDSWVSKGPNAPVNRSDVVAAIDDDTLNVLAQQTGMSRDELIERITRDLPEAVDRMTPDGELPRDGRPESNEPNLLDDVPPTRPG